MTKEKYNWTPECVLLLQENYSTKSRTELMEMFGCKYHVIGDKALQLGLKKSPEFMKSAASGRMLGNSAGFKTQFKKGHKPWHEGKEFRPGGRTVETQFKKGQINPNRKPLGTERLNKDGYLERKIAETGRKQKDWARVHVLLWQEHHGDVPAGHVVCFKDKDKKNITIENLECIPKTEVIRRNTIYRYPKELVQIIKLRSAIQRKIDRKMKNDPAS